MESEAASGMFAVGGYLLASGSRSADWRAGKCFLTWEHNCQQVGAMQNLHFAPALAAGLRARAPPKLPGSTTEQPLATTKSIVGKPGMKFIAYFTVEKVCV